MTVSTWTLIETEPPVTLWSLLGDDGTLTALANDNQLANVVAVVGPPATFQASGAGAVERTAQSKFSDIINLKDYGASVNGVANDLPAFERIATQFPTGGVQIVIDGYARINSTWTPPAGFSNVHLDFQGDGRIYNPDHGFDMLHLPSTVAGWRLHNPTFFTDNGASGGSASYFLYNESGDLIARDLWGRNCWSGVFNSGSKVSLEGRTYLNGMKPSSGVAVALNMDGAEHFWLEDIYAENAVGQDCLAGVQILSGTSIIIGGTVAKCGTGLLVNIASGKVLATLGMWPYFNADTGSGNGVWITGAGAIQRLEGVIRSSSNAGSGVLVATAPDSADLWIRAVDNTGRGVYLSSAASQNNSRYRMAGGGNGVHTFEAISGATRWTAAVEAGAYDGFGGSTQYGAVIGAACDNFTLDVNGVGDTLGLLFNGAGTSATKVVRSRA